MKTTCLYGELDTYSGSIPHSSKGLHTLIRDLKLACILYDQVLVNAGAFLEHPLTLPAFLHLRPFVQDGRIWTSSSKTIDPKRFVDSRIEDLLGNLKSSVKNEGIDQLKANWALVAPSSWRVFRSVSSQTSRATHNILGNIEHLTTGDRIGTKTLEPLSGLLRELNQDGLFLRELVMSKLGLLRHDVGPRYFHYTALIIQSEFLNQGTSSVSNQDIKLFPGRFVRISNSIDQFLQTSPPPFDVLTYHSVSQSLKSIGYPIQRLLDWHPQELYELVKSQGWREWRNHIVKHGPQSPLLPDIRSRLSAYQDLPRILDDTNFALSDHLESHLYLPEHWASSGRTLVGVGARRRSKNAFSLDMNSRVLASKSHAVTLGPFEAQIVALLALHPSGVRLEHIALLERERQELRKRRPQWQPSFDKDTSRQAAQRNRVDVLKSRLNRKLREHGLSIKNRRFKDHKWILSNSKNEIAYVNLLNTAWDSPKTVETPPTPPKNLSPQLELVWRIFSRSFGHPISSDYLRFMIGSDLEQKSISDIIYRFKRALRGTRFRVESHRHREYRLVETKRN